MIILGVTSSSDKNVPTAPTIGTATNVGTGRAYNNGAATVTFTPNYSGGLPVTYTATSSPGGFTASGSASPLTVTGLQSGVAYTFTVTATNSLGSATSAASNSITATTVPQAPTIGAATDPGTGTTISVAFTPGATGGSAITTYTATSSPGSITGTAASSPITVSGLTAGTAYTFTVTATNANGTSQASAASNSVTPSLPGSFETIATLTINNLTDATISGIPNTYDWIYVSITAITNVGSGAIYVKYNNSASSQNSFGNNSNTWASFGYANFITLTTTSNTLFPVSQTYILPNYTTTGTLTLNEKKITIPYWQNYASNYASMTGSTIAGLNPAISSVSISSSQTLMSPTRISVYGVKNT